MKYEVLTAFHNGAVGCEVYVSKAHTTVIEGHEPRVREIQYALVIGNITIDSCGDVTGILGEEMHVGLDASQAKLLIEPDWRLDEDSCLASEYPNATKKFVGPLLNTADRERLGYDV